ncbi:hypothetical protein I553_3085 [Mycobacterium xenopi 4042]|uniref:Uncharacterized protein n=1 Tax=Mycobacterium xenopi 4042 TaxID=1299334 RepID=X8E5H2_MYCXE|nr:hypothetical protein I553_3085 [Mycobacterium xenopi 4042]
MRRDHREPAACGGFSPASSDEQFVIPTVAGIGHRHHLEKGFG